MRLVYFSWVRQRIGIDAETVSPPLEVTTVGALLDWLRARGPGYAAALAEPGVVRVAVNQEYANLDQPVTTNDEVALFPPVTGG
ncbi:Molybdopterin synthase sulfur carrier subunit [uncultured Gammaproteobacteria bacterium]